MRGSTWAGSAEPGERKEAEAEAEEMGATKFGRRRRRRKSNSQRPRKERVGLNFSSMNTGTLSLSRVATKKEPVQCSACQKREGKAR